MLTLPLSVYKDHIPVAATSLSILGGNGHWRELSLVVQLRWRVDGIAELAKFGRICKCVRVKLVFPNKNISKVPTGHGIRLVTSQNARIAVVRHGIWVLDEHTGRTALQHGERGRGICGLDLRPQYAFAQLQLDHILQGSAQIVDRQQLAGTAPLRIELVHVEEAILAGDEQAQLFLDAGQGADVLQAGLS